MQTIKNSTMTFKEEILAGIPNELPQTKTYDPQVNHDPKRKQILSPEEEILAYRNALRYFDPKHHATLLPEFKHELETYGRIYMHRFKPDYKIYARWCRRSRSCASERCSVTLSAKRCLCSLLRSVEDVGASAVVTA